MSPQTAGISLQPVPFGVREYWGRLSICYLLGFPRRLENLENENGHGKFMEHEKLDKSHGILLSFMDFYQFPPQILPNL